MTGHVKTLIVEKRFGFIHCDQDGKEYFFHRDDFVGFFDDLKDDWKNVMSIPVEFEVAHSNKGPRAANVKRTDYPNQAV